METKRKTRIGSVVSTKMDKTAVVAVETLKRHPLYRKTFKKVVRYKAHDAENQCQLGDKVRIIETRPLSRQKRWRVAEIITREEVTEVKPQEINE
ncbi:MAG TPA: 30S ribosomal protein S17 [Dehalococcoidia bacterium]|nr:30S ribosomal protein S17 [Dehalococcoidia bacterium]